MKILITGASGFLGRHLSKRLRRDGHEILGLTSKDCDITKEGCLERALQGEKFDQIFHLAVYSRAGSYCSEHPGEQWVLNQKIDTNTLVYWRNHQPTAKMTAIGSSVAYDPELTLTEENYLKGSPIKSYFSYGNSKRMLYVGLESFHREFEMNYMFFVPTVLYGADYHKDGRPLHFIYDLTRKIIRGKLYGEEVVLWGNGEQTRELIHVNDFIETMLQIDSKNKNEVVNMSGTPHTIKQFARTICEIVDYDFNRIGFDTTKLVGAKSKSLDTTKMKRLYPGFRETPLKEGLKDVIDWMTENHNSMIGAFK